MQERATEIQTKLLFFELEWAAIEDERADELLDADGLDFCRHYLRSARRYRPHLLTEPEEKILAEKSISSQSAWARLFGELVSALRVGLDERGGAARCRALPTPAARARRTASGRRGGHRDARAGPPDARFIYNTLIHDKAVEDRLRSYPHWLASRNLANEASDESVMALINAVRGRYDIPQRWYRAEGEAARRRPDRRLRPGRAVSAEDVTLRLSEARELVVDTYRSFSPAGGRIVRRFFDEHWIDAPVRPNKRGGAFCSYTVPSVHPYVLLNYTARRRDVLTMAHELGHGLHAALAQPQGIFHQSTPLTLAETASVFGEALVFGRLLDEAADDAERLNLLADRIDGAIATVFRQMAMNRFEHLMHTGRRPEGELSADRISELGPRPRPSCSATRSRSPTATGCGGPTCPTSSTRPGYVYAYAYGQLLALSVYRRYLEEGPSFVPRYLELLAAGGSRSPEELGEIVGIDLADPGSGTRAWSSSRSS